MEGGSRFEGGRGDSEERGERVNGGSHISSILIFHDISPYRCLQIICHPPFYALRLLVRSNAILLSISSENKVYEMDERFDCCDYDARIDS